MRSRPKLLFTKHPNEPNIPVKLQRDFWRLLLPALLSLLATVSRGAAPDLTATMPPPHGASADIAFLSTVYVQNRGDASATNVRFTNSFPPHITILNAWHGGGACQVSNNVATCDLGSLQAGYNATVWIQAVGWSNGFVTNELSVGAAEIESTYTNNLVRQSMRVGVEKFFSAGRMTNPRVNHIALRLNDGRVLLIGGGPSSDEIFDPVARTYTAVASSNRFSVYGACVLNDGRVFLSGKSTNFAAGQIFNPATGIYGNPVLMPQDMYPYNCITLVDGTVLIPAPAGQPSFTFDPASNTFTTRASITMQYAYTLTRLLDGSVLFVGITNAERYLPASGQFVPAASLNHARYTHTATLLSDGRVLVVGDQTYEGILPAEIYDPAANTFTDTSTPGLTVGAFQSAPLPDNRVLFLSPTAAEIYDVASSTFLPVVAPEKPRQFPAVVALPNGAVFISGGNSGLEAPTAATEIFDPTNIYSLPRVIVNGTTVTEGTTSTNQALFGVGLSVPPPGGLTVTVRPFGVTADMSDFANAPVALVFSPSTTSQGAFIPIVPDTTYESTELFGTRLEDASWAVIARRYALATIPDDDPPPVFSVSDAGVVEPNVNWTNMTFTVRLTGPTAVPAKVDFFTEAVSAQAGSDFVSTNGTLTFLPGNSSTQTVIVRVLGDVDPEANETFRLRLTNAVDAVIGTPFGTGYITNTDAAAGFIHHFEWAPIATTQHVNIPFTIAIRAVDSVGNTVSNFTGSISVTSAISSNVAGPFILGQWSGAITISNLASQLVLRADDHDGHFGNSNPFDVAPTVNLSLLAVGTSLTPPLRVGGTLQYNSSVANFGPQTAHGIRLTNELPPNVVILSMVANGTCTANSNVVICDLIDLPPGAGAGASIEVRPHSIGSLTNRASVGSTEFDSFLGNNSVVITNYATLPTVTILDASALESDAGFTSLTFTARLSGISSQAVSAAWFTSDDTALSGSDYVAASGVVVFAPGVTNQTISVAVMGDVLVEQTETFRVSITHTTNAVYVPYYSNQPYAVGTISNDDFATIDIGDAIVVEGDAGTTNAVFVLTYTKPFAGTSYVSYAVSRLTTDTNDLFATNYTTLAVPPGVTNTAILVPVFGDTVNEPDETFRVQLTGADARFGRSVAVGMILNDDAVPGRLNSFVVSSPASPQFKNYPFGANATAVDYLGNLVSNYNGTVPLNAITDQGIVTQFVDDFEDGNFAGWTTAPFGGPPPALLDSGASSNRYSLVLSNGTRYLTHPLADSGDTSHVEFTARKSATNIISGQVYLTSTYNCRCNSYSDRMA